MRNVIHLSTELLLLLKNINVPPSKLGSTIGENEPFERPRPIGGTIPDMPVADPKPQNPQPPKREPAKPTSGLTGTINPYGGIGWFTPIPRCILKPVIFPGEDKRYAPQQVNIKGDYNELNRQMIDPDNNTITSKVQASLTHKDGKWYIQNESEQKTTFVRCDEPRELKSGDVILMGNRTFIFEED